MIASEREVAAEVLKAMAHPVRLGILEILAEGEKTCTELFEILGCSQSRMSQQIKILSRQRLVRVRKEGNVKYCGLQNRDFMKLFDCMHNHLRMFLNFKDSTGEHSI